MKGEIQSKPSATSSANVYILPYNINWKVDDWTTWAKIRSAFLYPETFGWWL